MSKKIKILIILLLFLFIMNIIYPVLAVDTKVFKETLGVTEEDIEESRKNIKWSELVRKFNEQLSQIRNGKEITLTDAELVRLLFYDAYKETDSELSDINIEKDVVDELNSRMDNKKSGKDTSTIEKDEQLAELYDKARAKQKEIDKSKDKEKTKELKKEFIDIVKEMESIDYKDKLNKDTNYNALLIQKNQYITDLGINEDGVIYKQPNIVTGSGNVDGTLDDMISDADSFVSKGNQADAIEIDGLKKLSVRLYDILLEIGIGAAVLIGIILGIKFLLSGVEEKAEVNKMLWVYTVGCIVTFGAFGIWKLVVTILQKI